MTTSELRRTIPCRRLADHAPAELLSREWLVTQLSSGAAPDVIQINVEDVWQDIQKVMQALGIGTGPK